MWRERMKVRILRQESPVSKPYWQEFSYEGSTNQTVAGLIDELNYRDDLKDINGKPAPRISWECSCLLGMCGGCAMVINGRPALACETFLRNLKGDVVTIEPLKKFPTISDLVVDRGSIQENLKKVNACIEEYKGADPREYDQMYATAKCLKCGLCLEVCPNYKGGKTFFGAAFANDCYLISTRSKTMDEPMKKAYTKHFSKSCSKALSCVEVCPMEIPTLKSIASMNRRK